ncbi:MAG: M23 family metallopeptidase [Deltaproteobacteria bacterium]|nr:M23 family metallopeptidase [Deltaproteobacteria bacterium]
MRQNQYIRRSSVVHVGSRARRIAFFLAVVGLIGAGVVLCLASMLPSGFLYASNIPSSAVEPGNGATADFSEETSSESVDQGANGAQEIEDLTGQGDTLVSLLNANLPDDDSVQEVAKSLVSVIRHAGNKAFSEHTILKEGTSYNLAADEQGRFLKMRLNLDPANVFHAERDGNALRCWKEEVVLDFKAETISIPIRGSFEESIRKAGEGEELVTKLKAVFRWDIDFQSECKRGDTCKVLFERRYADDRPSGYGRILCAVYDGNKTKRKMAIFFNDHYYDEEGKELKKNFLRSPLSNMKVTSRYGQRLHPILKVWRKHDGVDYGAPTGTAVWSVASGVVTFAGWKNGYGNYVCIQHDNGDESRYGHLHRILVKKGARVKQSHRIGLVGQTGQATGPHLDFQLLMRGRHQDPCKVKMVHTVRSVDPPLRERFFYLKQQREMFLEGIALGRKSLGEESARIY